MRAARSGDGSRICAAAFHAAAHDGMTRGGMSFDGGLRFASSALLAGTTFSGAAQITVRLSTQT
ncbi:MAG: hypothetical protein MRY59_08945 [Aquisalinus sp.]|nr:hypothetical protein [Aquisalinus sp.]